MSPTRRIMLIRNSRLANGIHLIQKRAKNLGHLWSDLRVNFGLFSISISEF